MSSVKVNLPIASPELKRDLLGLLDDVKGAVSEDRVSSITVTFTRDLKEVLGDDGRSFGAMPTGVTELSVDVEGTGPRCSCCDGEFNEAT